MTTGRQKAGASPPPNRKRARKFLRIAGKAAVDDHYKITDEDIAAVRRFTQEHLVFKIYAAAARRAGDPAIRPRDYYCGCEPSLIDGLPVCEEKKPGCRFAGRISIEEIDEHFGDAHAARSEKRISAAIAAAPNLDVRRCGGNRRNGEK